MTLDQIDRMVRQANPVPDLTALEPVDASVLDEQRRTEMQTHDRVIVNDEGGDPKRGRNLLIGIAAAAAIIVGALLLLRPLTNDAPVADSPTTITEAPSIATAVEVATAFVEAYAVFDADTAASYLAPEADLSALESFGESWRLTNRLMQAQGSKLLLDTCIGRNATPMGALVRCLYAFQGFGSDELGLGPFTGSWYDITVNDGKIVSVSGHQEFINNGFAERVWEPFSEWVSQTYPEDAAIMYSVESLSPEAAEESIALWEQRSREYVAVAQERAEAESIATAFVEAYGSFDIDQAASYLAPDANLGGLDGGEQNWRTTNTLLEAMGFKLLLDSCETRGSSSSGTEVRCRFDFHGIRSDEIGLGPYSGSWFDFRTLNGKIVSVWLHWGIAEYSPEMWEPFTDWVDGKYPEDSAVMLNTTLTKWLLSEESIALWEQRTREYVEVAGS